MLAKKTKRVSIRVAPKVKKHLDGVAAALGTNLSDLLVVGGMLIECRAKTSAQYLKLKAAALEEVSETNGA